MHATLLALLRCPFCGMPVTVVAGSPARRHADRVDSAVVGCGCCAYPVVAGIPVLVAGDRERAAITAIESGRHDDALEIMLAPDEARRPAVRALVRSHGAIDYREALDVLGPDAEGTYFRYRLSDPTFVTASGVLGALAETPTTMAGWTIDLCSGAGHLTRVLAGLGGGNGRTIAADLYFWKLWLTTRVTAPGVHAVCCDANDPLPFDRGVASLVMLSDAFPYIWRRRALAEELMRLVGPAGTLVMPHLHSALGENMSAGMTLTPAGYADLFAPLGPRLFPDRTLFETLVDEAVVDLTGHVAPEAIVGEPSLTLVASRDPGVYRRVATPPATAVTGALVLHPLYAAAHASGATVLTLRFPTPEDRKSTRLNSSH